MEITTLHSALLDVQGLGYNVIEHIGANSWRGETDGFAFASTMIKLIESDDRFSDCCTKIVWKLRLDGCPTISHIEHPKLVMWCWKTMPFKISYQRKSRAKLLQSKACGY